MKKPILISLVIMLISVCGMLAILQLQHNTEALADREEASPRHASASESVRAHPSNPVRNPEHGGPRTNFLPDPPQGGLPEPAAAAPLATSPGFLERLALAPALLTADALFRFSELNPHGRQPDDVDQLEILVAAYTSRLKADRARQVQEVRAEVLQRIADATLKPKAPGSQLPNKSSAKAPREPRKGVHVDLDMPGVNANDAVTHVDAQSGRIYQIDMNELPKAILRRKLIAGTAREFGVAVSGWFLVHAYISPKEQQLLNRRVLQIHKRTLGDH